MIRVCPGWNPTAPHDAALVLECDDRNAFLRGEQPLVSICPDCEIYMNSIVRDMADMHAFEQNARTIHAAIPELRRNQ